MYTKYTFTTRMSDSEDEDRVTKLNFKKSRIHFGPLDENKTIADAPVKPVEEVRLFLFFLTLKRYVYQDSEYYDSAFVL